MGRIVTVRSELGQAPGAGGLLQEWDDRNASLYLLRHLVNASPPFSRRPAYSSCDIFGMRLAVNKQYEQS
jgi:hypothetical protein